MTALVFGIFGLIIGSFLNVVILRHGERSLGGRSACMSCGKTLAWYDMVPVFSWLALAGKCRSCKAYISVQYPLVEALTGIAFAFIGASALLLPAQILGCIMAALLIAISVYDLQHTIIPDPWVYSFAVLALVSQFFFPLTGQLGVLAFLAGPIAALPLFALWLVSRGAWMGFGDVKLALGMGWLLGPIYGIVAVFFGFVIGAVISVPLLFLSTPAGRRVIQGVTSSKSAWGFTMKSEIPFGPFLIASTFIIWILLIYSLDPLAFVGLSPL